MTVTEWLAADVAHPGDGVRTRLARRIVGGVAAGRARRRVRAPPAGAARCRAARAAAAHHPSAHAAQVRGISYVNAVVWLKKHMRRKIYTIQIQNNSFISCVSILLSIFIRPHIFKMNSIIYY